MWDDGNVKLRKSHLIDKMMGLKPVVVCLDDEEDSLDIIKDHIEAYGLEVFAHTDKDVVLEFLNKNKSRTLMIISDYRMQGYTGFDFKNAVDQFASEVPFVILSGYVDRELALQGVSYKITAFLEKPFHPSAFVEILKKDGESRAETLRDEYEMLKGFTDDASNLLDNIEDLCLDLESNPFNPDTIARIFGMVHTIKGSSGFFEPRTLHAFSHRFEDLLKEVQSGTRQVTPGLVSIFLKGNDVLKILVGEFSSGEHQTHDLDEMLKIFSDDYINNLKTDIEINDKKDENAVTPSTAIKEQKSSELRVSMTLLDEFMQTSGEMTVIRNMINKTVKSLEKQYQGDKEIALLGELLEEMHKVNSDVQNKITDIRRVSVASLTKPLIRTVRDTARALGKDVDFVIEGDDLRLDNSIAEVLSKSLVHMMRNSLDHGVESPEVRASQGKKTKGKLYLRFVSQNDNIRVEIEDDGAGINIEKIRERVIAKGLRSPIDAERMSANELNFMIFDAGFSTAEQITEFSGRGVGMSMVKDSVESLKGRILIESQLKIGSKFTLEIPIPKSVMIMNCLFVSVNDLSYGLPQDSILKVIEKSQLTKNDYTELEGAQVIRFGQQLIPLCSLSCLMGVDGRMDDERLVIIMKSENSIFALQVESVLDIEDAVIKTLNIELFKKLEIYLGGTFLGDGTVGLVFNVAGLATKVGIRNQHIPVAESLDENLTENKMLEENVLVIKLNKQGQFCLKEKDVFRIERLKTNELQSSGPYLMMPYRDTTLTILDLDEMIHPKSGISFCRNTEVSVVIIKHQERYIGLKIHEIVDLKKAFGSLEVNIKKQWGIEGCYIIDNKAVSLISLSDILQKSSNNADSTSDENLEEIQSMAA